MLIEIKDMYKTYSMGDTKVNALDGVSLSIDYGEFVALMGPSRPSSLYEPEVGWSSAPRMFSIVLLPEPECPMIATNSP